MCAFETELNRPNKWSHSGVINSVGNESKWQILDFVKEEVYLV